MAAQIEANPYMLEFLSDIGGAKSIDVVKTLARKKEVDEFSLAEKLKMNVKAVRRILYRLYDKKLVSFRKTRDKDRGWYVYIWRIEQDKLSGLLENRKETAISDLRGQLDYEVRNQFFKCDSGCIRVPFEEAFELEFLCPECGSKLQHFDNATIVDQLRKYIQELELSVGG